MNNEEKRIRQRENSRKYYERHKEEILKRQKEYVRKRYNTDEEFREKQLRKHKEYCNKYPEKTREIKRKSQFKYMQKKRENGELPKTKGMIIEELLEENKQLKERIDEFEYLEKVADERMSTILDIEKYCIDEKEDLINGCEVCEDILKMIAELEKGDSNE